MKIRNINTEFKESPDDWDVKACQFVTQEIGRFSVKFSVPCIGGTVNLNCSHITNACNPFDAVMRFERNQHAGLHGVRRGTSRACAPCLSEHNRVSLCAKRPHLAVSRYRCDRRSVRRWSDAAGGG